MKPTKAQAWVSLLIIILTGVSSFLGIDVYQQRQAASSTILVPQRSEQEVKAIAKDIAESLLLTHETDGRFHE